MAKIAMLKKASDCVCLNETTRTGFEVMARNVFRKYKALYPEKQAKKYTKSFNAIEAIYDQLNQKVKSADVTAIMMELQAVVSESIFIQKEGVYIDLSQLDFDKLKAAFAKTQRKNTVVYDLQRAIGISRNV